MERRKFEGFALELDVSKKIAHQLGRVPEAARERIYHFVVGALKRGEDMEKVKKMSPESKLAMEVDGQKNFLDDLPS